MRRQKATNMCACAQTESDLYVRMRREVEEADGGQYECQVSSLPVLSFFIQLNVVGKCIPGFDNLLCETGALFLISLFLLIIFPNGQSS